MKVKNFLPIKSKSTFFILYYNNKSKQFWWTFWRNIISSFLHFFSVLFQNWPHKIKINRECIHVLYIFKGLHTGSESFQPFFRFCFFVYSKFPDIFFILLKVWFCEICECLLEGYIGGNWAVMTSLFKISSKYVIAY